MKKNIIETMLAWSLSLIILLVVGMALSSCSNELSCKSKVKTQKKSIRAKQNVVVQPYYVRIKKR